MPLDKTARAFVPRVDQVPESKIEVPHTQVTCECPAPCWVALKTLDSLKNTGMPYKFHCTKCCPDEFRNTIQAVADRARADPHRDKGEPIAGIFGKGIGLVIEGKPYEISELIKLAQEEQPGEREPVTITMTLDVGEWVDILTTLEQTAIWLERANKPSDPTHPRGRKYMSQLSEKVKRYVKYEIGRQVIKKKP